MCQIAAVRRQTPRRDMNPMLARRLGIEPHRGLKPDEVACLLNGQRADGGAIEGRVQRASSLPLAQIFGLDAAQMPTREQLEQILAGRKVNGDALPARGSRAGSAAFAGGSGRQRQNPYPRTTRRIFWRGVTPRGVK